MTRRHGTVRTAAVLAFFCCLLFPFPAQPQEVHYDPEGRRDPFRPFTLSFAVPKKAAEPQTPLQRYEVGQLKLVAIILDLAEPRAMVEDSSGLGYIIQRGTLIGPNGGVVKAIQRGRVIVEEVYTDYYGEQKTQQVMMELAPAEEGGKQ